jgi:hypothetical protein
MRVRVLVLAAAALTVSRVLFPRYAWPLIADIGGGGDNSGA